MASERNGKRQKLQENGTYSSTERRTVAIAVPGSVIDNAQTAELATAIAGQLARTAAIFNIDEVIVLDDTEGSQIGRGAAFLARVLQYLETPQYLRKQLIPLHEDLRHAGLLPPLDAPHHMRATEWCKYREGVVTQSVKGEGSLVNVGLEHEACISEVLKPGIRVTLKMGPAENMVTPSAAKRKQKLLSGTQHAYDASLASPADPPEDSALYWGYQTRIAQSVKELVENTPHKGGYDLVLGTSEHGSKCPSQNFKLPAFSHLLIVFGGPLGLEDWFLKDNSISEKDPSSYFDKYINTCSNQGSRTIRTEEAILISLSYLQPALAGNLQ